MDPNYKLKTQKTSHRKVCQYDTDGNFIKEFPSIAEATRQVGGNISKVLSGKQTLAGGYKWKYSD